MGIITPQTSRRRGAKGFFERRESLRYRDDYPLAPADYIEGVMIDDRVGILVANRARLGELQAGAPARDQ